MQWKGREYEWREGSVVLQYSSTAINTDIALKSPIIVRLSLKNYHVYYKIIKSTLLAESLHNLNFYLPNGSI